MGLVGLSIGFYGYLFPGNINIMILDLYTSKKYQLLILTLGLILFFESAYCIATLLLLNGIDEHSSIYHWMETGSLILIMVMGLLMMLEKKKSEQKLQQHRLYRGFFCIIVHPQQIPFWLLVGVLVNPLMRFGSDLFTLAGFLFFNAAGTLLAMMLYMFFGSRVLKYFRLNLSKVNRVLGFFYISFGMYSLVNMAIQ